MITQEAITSALGGSAPVHHLGQIVWAPGDLTYVTHTEKKKKTSVYSILFSHPMAVLTAGRETSLQGHSKNPRFLEHTYFWIILSLDFGPM